LTSKAPAPTVDGEVAPPRLSIGMAVYDDFPGVYFTVQALRTYHREAIGQVELIVVDNHPDGLQGRRTADFIAGLEGDAADTRYVPYTECLGTSAPRDQVFRIARGEAVLCMDPHVMVAPGAIRRLIDWYASHPECGDLLTGPLLYDDLRQRSTHFADAWRGEMWGTWGTDPRADPASPAYSDEPFEIPAMGLGLFSCRRDAWLGFNPGFRGFGGEEHYIHEKYRLAGRRNVCLPWLGWLHRFARPAGVPYPLHRWHRVRNYVIGHTELGLPLDRVHEHFVAGGSIDEAQWAALVRDPAHPPEEDPTRAAGASASRRSTVPRRPTLARLYRQAAEEPSDIHGHVPKLRELASQCAHVTELGTRYGVSTTALLAGQPRTLRCYDPYRDPMVDVLKHRQGRCAFSFEQASSLAVEIEPTDLLFIDTVNTADHLWQELTRHAGKVRRWIVLHDTTTFGEIGEGGAGGVLFAVRRFLREHREWRVIYSVEHDNGLMVLSREPEEPASRPSAPRRRRSRRALPKVSCVCPTSGRPPTHQHLLEEAIESFLRQEYDGERELIVLNDCPGQILVCEAPGVRVIDLPSRAGSLGEKYNAMIELARGELIFPWEDDDISLPWRIRQGVEQLDASRPASGRGALPWGAYWKPPQVWFLPAGHEPQWQHPAGVRHHASVFRKDAWRRAGGYPPVSGAQDAALDAALGGGALPVFPGGLEPGEWAYLYRWGVQPHHLSGVAPHDDFYRRLGELAHVPGRYLLDPHWREDYVAATRRVLARTA
jgi:hypothetical protein